MRPIRKLKMDKKISLDWLIRHQAKAVLDRERSIALKIQ